jgi:hypothetical protein
MFKISKIRPILKGEDESNISNYRPISILPVFSKILEKIMFKRLNSFIEKNNILSNQQFGFRQGKSMDLKQMGKTTIEKEDQVISTSPTL